ncbi:MAG: cytochrome c oxidase subunit 3 [Alphaproteobacteria bacterium]|nr:cytochrome c oxidase subunit 3 [Rhodospirillales bacterium]MCW9045394.1 cytochrome c oxidase subunit 3 [Alphaproteobacteria bacterium]
MSTVLSQDPTHEQKHPFHLVDPSPWPALGAVSTLTAAVGLVLFAHDEGPALLVIGFVLILTTMFLWWRDLVREGAEGGHHTHEVRVGLRQGVVLFIASEVMFFFAFFWAFFYNGLGISKVITQWPPEGIETLDPWGLPLLNTVILISSGVILEWGHRGLKQGHYSRLKLGLALSTALGFIFLIFQAQEYGHAAFGFTDGIYPSVFYMTTGFHGAHVLIGAIFLLVCWVRSLKEQFTEEGQIGLEAAIWYWHFVDVVWIFLFVWVYIWGA